MMKTFLQFINEQQPRGLPRRDPSVAPSLALMAAKAHHDGDKELADYYMRSYNYHAKGIVESINLPNTLHDPMGGMNQSQQDLVWASLNGDPRKRKDAKAKLYQYYAEHHANVGNDALAKEYGRLARQYSSFDNYEQNQYTDDN